DPAPEPAQRERAQRLQPRVLLIWWSWQVSLLKPWGVSGCRGHESSFGRSRARVGRCSGGHGIMFASIMFASFIFASVMFAVHTATTCASLSSVSYNILECPEAGAPTESL